MNVSLLLAAASIWFLIDKPNIHDDVITYDFTPIIQTGPF